MRATRKVIVAAVVVAFCAAAGAALAIPAHAQSLENPARPSNLAATSTLTTVTLTWDDPGDSTITGYKILSRITATESVLTILVSDTGSAGTSYTVRGLEPDATYQFAVLAVNNAGNSAPSQIVTVSTRAQTAPPSDTAALASIIESLTGIIEGLSLKITALEAEIVDLRGTLGGRIVAPVTDSGDFVPVYYAATDHHNLVQKSHYEDQLFLENLTGRLTQTLALPYDVYLTMDECGEPEAVYYPYYARIVLCYEFVTFLEGRLAPYYGTNAELSRGVSDFVTWVMLSELGRALIDVYDLPVTGNEEDAVDQFATVIALEYIPPDQAGNVLSSTLRAWSLGQNDVSLPEPYPVGSDPLASHRLHKVACWIYGSDVHAFSNFVDSGLLTEARAGQCPSEYERMSESWYRLASQFLIEGGPVIRLNGDAALVLYVGDAYIEAGATCTDAKGGSLTAVRTSNAPNTNVAGTYTLEYSCTDAAGNAATATRVVTVIGIGPDRPDTDAPVITVNPGIDAITAGGQWADAGATCVDARDGTLPVTTAGTVDSTRPGTYTITYACEDAAGNSAAETRTVTVSVNPATISLTVTPGQWDDGVLELAISGTAANVADGTVTVTSGTIPSFGEYGIPVTNNVISGVIPFANVTVSGTHTFTATSSDGATTGSDAANIPPAISLTNVVHIGSWIDADADNDPTSTVDYITLRVAGTESVSGAVTLSVLDEDGELDTQTLNVPVRFDDNNQVRLNITETAIQGPTQFVLATTYAGVTAASNSWTANMPVLLTLDGITVGEWDGEGNLALEMTGSRQTIVPAIANSIDVKIFGSDAAIGTVTGYSDGVVNGTVTLGSDDLSLSGTTTQFVLVEDTGAPDTIFTSNPLSRPIPPILANLQVTTAGSNAGQWNNGQFEVRVTGLSNGIAEATEIDLQANDGGGWETVVPYSATGLRILPGGDIRATVPITDISLSGDTVFRLVTGTDRANDYANDAASSNSTAVRIPRILASLPTVTPVGDWAANGELTINVKGISGLGPSGTSLQLHAVKDNAFVPVGGANTDSIAGGNIDYNAALSDVSLAGTAATFKLAVTVGGNVAESGNRTVSIPAALTLTDVSFGPAGWTNTTADNHRLNLFVTGNSKLSAGATLQVSSNNGETWTDVGAASSAAGDISDAVIPLTDTDLAGESVMFRLEADSGANAAASAPVSRVVPALPSGSNVDMTPTPISFPTQNGFPPITGAVIGDISEMPAVHTVQVTQSYQTIAMLARSVVDS